MKAIELVIRNIPFPHQVKNIEDDGDSAVLFDWRNVRYRVTSVGFCDEVGDGVLIGTDRAILMQALLIKGCND